LSELVCLIVDELWVEHVEPHLDPILDVGEYPIADICAEREER
jgi:hypothetical protein